MDAVVITGIGIVTAVGQSAPQALTSITAGIARFEEVSQYEPIARDPAVHFSEPLIGAPVSGLTDGLVGIERLFALAVPALGDALSDSRLRSVDIEGAALIVAGGERPDVARGSRTATVFVPRLASRVSRTAFARTDYLPSGSAGFLLALGQGIDLLRKGACRSCVIGGVDSWMDLPTLAWLDERRRLKTQSSIDAFIPGEAAGFVVIELRPHAERRNARIHAQISDVSSSVEKHTIWTDAVCTGDALAACLGAVLKDLERRDATAGTAFCDMNGESYRASEWAYACVKTFHGRHAAPQAEHPADCIGDVGAAMAPILIALAAGPATPGRAGSTPALVWCSSDNGARAACAILAPNA